MYTQLQDMGPLLIMHALCFIFVFATLVRHWCFPFWQKFVLFILEACSGLNGMMQQKSNLWCVFCSFFTKPYVNQESAFWHCCIFCTRQHVVLPRNFWQGEVHWFYTNLTIIKIHVLVKLFCYYDYYHKNVFYCKFMYNNFCLVYCDMWFENSQFVAS